MAAYDERARASAARKLAPKSRGGKGVLVGLTGLSIGAYDTADATADVTAGGKIYGSGIELAYEARLIDGSVIRAGDKKFLMSALRFNNDGTLQGGALAAPAADQTLVRMADGKDWTVKAVETLAPAGLAITYTLQLRNT